MPKEERKKKKLDKILQAALELFVRKGYHGTSVKDITERIGLVRSGLYSHFTSKADLALELLDIYETQFVDEIIKETTEYEGDALAKMHREISVSSALAGGNPDLVALIYLARGELLHHPTFEEKLKQIEKKWVQFLSDIISMGIKQGVFRKNLDPELVALLIMGQGEAIFHIFFTSRDSVGGAHYSRTVRQMIINSLKSD
jgi:AcrR family transcriptional regulator